MDDGSMQDWWANSDANATSGVVDIDDSIHAPGCPSNAQCSVHVDQAHSNDIADPHKQNACENHDHMFSFEAMMEGGELLSPSQNEELSHPTPTSVPSLDTTRQKVPATYDWHYHHMMSKQQSDSEDDDWDLPEMASGGETDDEDYGPAQNEQVPPPRFKKFVPKTDGLSMARSKSESRSLNPSGRTSTKTVRPQCTPAGSADALLYECPKKCPVECAGIRMSSAYQAANPDAKNILLTDIARVRQLHNLNVNAKGKRRLGNKTAVVSQLLWELTGGDKAVTDVGKLQFKLGQRPVCKWCYMAAAGMLQQPGMTRPSKSWADGQKCYYQQERGASPVKKMGDGPCLKNEFWGQKYRSAFGWIVQFCQLESGNDVQHGTTDTKLHIVATTRKDIKKEYDEYLVTKRRPGLTCSQSCFNNALKDMNSLAEHPTLQIDKWSFHAECATCVAIKVLIRRAMKSKDSTEIKLREAQLEWHKGQARNERLTYAWRISRGLFFKFCISICMDGYDNRKSSGPALYTKSFADCKGFSGLGSAEQLKFKTTGVLVHGVGGYYVYVADPTVPCGANFNLECLFQTLVDLQDRVAKGELPCFPPELCLQVDGASDNKASVVFMFMEWLVRTRVFTSVVVSFLMVGHTHNDADQQFVPLTYELRKSVIKSLSDYLAAIKTAYKDPPKAVRHVQAIHDFTEWLKVDFGERFAGFARRTPDAERPHQFTFELDDSGAVQMNYKQFSFDVDAWNKKPIQLLSDVPDHPPSVEVPNVKHLAKLAASRPGVFKNFNMNQADAAFFSAADIKQYSDMFDVFSYPDGRMKSVDALKAAMQSKLAPFTKLQPTVQDLETIMTLAAADRGPEPIVHANQTAAEQKQIQAHYKAKASERPRLSRGTKALNAATLRVMQRLEQQADSRLVQAADHAVFVDNVEIVGADSSKRGYEMMYLCHWTHPRWSGHPKEFQWVPASDMGPEKEDSDADYSGSDIDHEESDSDADSWEADDEPLAQRAARVATGKRKVTKLPGQMQLQFTDALLHQAVDVSWQNQDGKEQVIQHYILHHHMLTCSFQVYKGTLVQQGILEEPDWFKVQYEDGDAEWMSLSTLETDGTLGLQGTAERRVKWCLSEHTVVTNGLLSQATGACVMQSNKDAGEANADLQGEVAQAQSEINAGNKRPTRAAKTRAQDALGGAAVAPAPSKESQKTRTKRKKAGAAADGAGKSTQVDKEPKNKNKQTPTTKATPAGKKSKAQQTPVEKATPAAGESTRGAKRHGGRTKKPAPKRQSK